MVMMATLLIDALIIVAMWSVAWCLLGAALAPFVLPREDDQ